MAALSCEKCLKPPELGMSLLLCRSVGTPYSQFTFEVNLQAGQKIKAEPAPRIGDIFGWLVAQLDFLGLDR